MKTRILALLVATALATATQMASAENLLQIYQQAKSHDAQFKAQESAHLAILEKKQQALAGLKPQVNLSGSANYNTSRDSISNTTVDGNLAQYSLEISQSLFNKQLSSSVSQTDALIGQSTAALAANRQDLVIRVTNAYFAALTAQDTLSFATAEKNAISRQLEQANAYFEAGRSAITDVKEAEASYAASVAQEIAATQQLDVAREQLRVLTGGFYNSLNGPRADLPMTMPTPAGIEAWVNMAKQNNPLIRASQQSVLVAKKGVDFERGAKYPKVNLYASQSSSYLDNDIYKNKTTDSAAVGVNLSVPLYTGGSLSSKVRGAQHTLQQAQQLADLQSRQTEQQTRSAFLSVQSSISQVKANQQALASAETAAEATQAGFEVGTRTAVDVLNSLRSVFKARRDYAGSRYSYLQNTLALRQAAGTLGDKDIAAISAFMTVTPAQVAADNATPSTQDVVTDDTQVGTVVPKGAKGKPAEPAKPTAAAPKAEAVEGKQGNDDGGSYEYYVMPGERRI
jgi:outer membrane protein